MSKRQLVKIILILFSFIPSLIFSREKKVIYIGIASNFSDVMANSYNPFGNSVRNGVQLALDKVNAELALDGIEIRTKEFDYGENRLNIKKTVHQAANSNVVAVIGYEFSDDALLAAPWHQKLKIPMITPSASADRLETFSSFVHQGTFNNSYQGKVLAHFIIAKLHLKKAIVLTAVDCAYCQDLTKAFINKFVKFSGIITQKIVFLSDDKNFDDLLSQLETKNYDVIVVPNQELTSARIVTALRRKGINKPIFGGDGWRTLGNDFFASELSKQFVGYMVAHWHSTLTTPVSARFVKQYKRKFGSTPTDSAALAYDTTHILGEVIKKLDRIDRTTIEEALVKFKYFRGITGQFFFTPSHAPRKSILLMRATPYGFVVDQVLEPSL